MQRRLRKKYVKKLQMYVLPLFVSLLLAGGTLYGVNFFVSSDISKAPELKKVASTNVALVDVNSLLKGFVSTDVTDVPIDVPDQISPDKPTLTYPTVNKITKSYDQISGTVPVDTEKVEVNGYILKKYVVGSGEWKYFLSADQGNMIIGKNTYIVYAYDKSGNKSEPLNVDVIYMP